MTTHPTLDEPTLRELAERLLQHPHPDGPTSVELIVGALPDSLPATLPLPAGGRVIGSALYSRGDRRLSMSAVFDVRETPPVALTKYETELTRHGWTTPEDFRPMHGGFVSSETGEWRSYREDDQGPDLTAVVRARDGGSSEVQLRLNWDAVHRPRRSNHAMPPGADLLPRLHPPAGAVMIRGASGGGGDGHWDTTTTLRTERSVAELEEHLAGQLIEAGWTRVAGSTDAAVGWSTWEVPGDGSWRGVLVVLAVFESAERFLTLRIEEREQP
jgi:hypothetical protein